MRFILADKNMNSSVLQSSESGLPSESDHNSSSEYSDVALAQTADQNQIDINEFTGDTVAKDRLITKKVIAWSSWDWASSAFNSVATTFIFTIFLTKKDLFADGNWATTALSIGLTIAGLIIAVLAPISGQKADHKGQGTFMLGIFSSLVALCLAGMFFVHPNSILGRTGAMWLGVFLLAAGSIFYEFGSVNYNAMLSRVARKRNMGKISGLGWGMGYLGGIVLLSILYFGFIAPEVGWFGVTSENNMDVRISMALATVWYVVFAIPVLIVLPGRKRGPDGKLRPLDMSGRLTEIPPSEPYNFFKALRTDYRELWQTVARLAKYAPNTLRFLIASAIFRDGLAGVFTYGAILGTTVFGLDSDEILVFAIAANVVAGLATILLGTIDDFLGAKFIILFSLFSMVICGFILFFWHNGGAGTYWTFGLLLCIFVGPTQSASRSYLARIIPDGKEGEIFGLYATTGRAVSFLCPLSFALFIWLGQSLEGHDAQHWGVLGINLLLLLGLLLTITVKGDTHGQAEAFNRRVRSKLTKRR